MVLCFIHEGGLWVFEILVCVSEGGHMTPCHKHQKDNNRTMSILIIEWNSNEWTNTLSKWSHDLQLRTYEIFVCSGLNSNTNTCQVDTGWSTACLLCPVTPL